MRKIFTLIPALLLLCAYSGTAQTFWTENFTGGSTGLDVASYTGPNGAWTLTVTGSEGADANQWYVSCEEAGHLAGDCGTSCSSSMGLGGTLHLASTTIGDNGASYDAGGLCPILFCPQTDRRANSPLINCTGKYNIRMKFYFIHNGQGTTDNATLYYSADGGGAWSLLPAIPKTLLCSGQGKWDTMGVVLPASANNNPNVKIGFRWVNNDDGSGTDPSFAVDSISLTTPAATGTPDAIMTASTTTLCSDSCATFTNTSTGTASIDSFNWKSEGVAFGTVNTSPVTLCFTAAGTFNVKLFLYDGGIAIDSATTVMTVKQSPHPVIIKTGTTLSISGTYTSYQWYNGIAPISGATNASYIYTTPAIYGVMVDSNGCKGIAIKNTVSVEQINGSENTFWIAQQQGNSLPLYAASPLDAALNVNVYDATGRSIATSKWEKGTTSIKMNDLMLPAGLYIVRLTNDNTNMALRWLRE